MNCCFTERNSAGRNAGAKAPADVASICAAKKWKLLVQLRAKHTDSVLKRIRCVLSCVWCWLTALLTAKRGEIVLYQYPMYFGTAAARRLLPLLGKKGVVTAVLIHDADCLRGRATGEAERREIAFLSCFDRVICHNACMRDALIRRGVPAGKLVLLGLFDYLCSETPKKERAPRQPYAVAIAGNLDPVKCAYIEAFAAANPTVPVRLYGGPEPTRLPQNARYLGSFPPDTLPAALDADFGLVWDGDSIDGCAGDTGAYLRYNNPHKLSLYLCAGMPVVIWREAATAELVKEQGLGIVTDSLRNLSELFSGVSETEYRQMAARCRAVGRGLLNGESLSAALLRIAGGTP